jgi:hypothetical protein
MGGMYLAPTRPAQPFESASISDSNETMLLALFEDAAMASAAIRHTGARLLREASPGVVMLAADQGLRERLYAAGAMLVVR